MIKIIAIIENFVETAGRYIAWLTLFMVLTMFVVVVLRYVFDIGSIALQESITYMHAAVFLVGASYTLKHEAHVRVDIFYNRMSETRKAIVNLFGSIFLLMPMVLFIAWISWEYITDSWSVMEGSRQAGGLPGVFLLKSLILVMSLLLVLQALTQAARSLLTLQKR